MNAQIFSNTLTLEQYGAIENKIPWLQATATLGINPFRALRTNDFQPLELRYQTYSSNRQMLRMGALLNSQSPAFYANNPPGPGLTFPDIVVVSNSTVLGGGANITIDTNGNRIVFSAVEFGTAINPQTVNLVSNPTVSQTAQTDILTYTTPLQPASSLIDYNVIGNVFHDMQYTNFTPLLSCPLDDLFEVTVFTSSGPQTFQPWMPPSGQPVTMTLPAGNKLRLTFYNPAASVPPQANVYQTWVIYLQDENGNDHSSPPAFEAVFGQTPATLTAQSSFSGFIRAAIIQTDSVPLRDSVNKTQPPAPVKETPDWSTGIEIQTIAPSPAALFMLWPVEFLKNATEKIEFNLRNQIYFPNCAILSFLLPVLARNDIYTAYQYFSQLVGKQLLNPSSSFDCYTLPNSVFFDCGTNPFLTYLYMAFARAYKNDISCYQTNQRPFPNYGITGTPASVEAVYDEYRNIIPINTEISVALNQYSWTYTTIGSAIKNPLILFPGYKTVNPVNPPVQGFLINDPLKGPLYAVDATNKQIVFDEAPLPDFLMAQFYPMDFWRRLSPFDIILANRLMSLYFNDPVNLTDIQNVSNNALRPEAYSNGKLLYKAASCVRYGTALMAYLDVPKATIISITKPFVDAIKQAFQQWLFQQQATSRTNPMFPSGAPNFFIGDSTIGGICYPVHAMNLEGDVNDGFGNAYYNDHHFQYGYWLGAAAAVINWDNQYGTEPWVAQLFLSGVGAGPFKMKSFIDVLWRDPVNPDTQDSSFPYHRMGNPWEGHSTASGVLPVFYAAGRNQESLAEDFNCWLGTLFYAKAILETNAAFPQIMPPPLNPGDLQGFDTLVNFCTTFLSMTATSGNLYYKTSHWPYVNTPFNFNVTVGNQFDGLVDSATFFPPDLTACPVCN